MTITGTWNVGSWVGGFDHYWGSIQSRGRGPLAEHSESPLQDIYPRHPPSLLWETERKLKWHFFRYSVNTVKHWKKITLICLFGINNHLIERRSVMSHFHGSNIFLDHNHGELKQQRRWPWQEWWKSNQFISAKLFCTFLSRCCKSAPWNFLISCACLIESMNTAQEFSFSFSKFRYGPFVFNPRQFRQGFTN